jgi:hypothetical protein
LKKSREEPRQYQERLLTAISIGFFLLLVGSIFLINLNLFADFIELIKNFELRDVPNTNIILPAPASPDTHSMVYQALQQFSIALTIFQVIILALRFIISSSWEKRSETVGNLVFWAGTSFLIQLFLIETTQWFAFWSIILVLLGVSIITRSIVMAVARI